MATNPQFGFKGKSRNSYLKLVMAFPLASIKSDLHLEAAQQVMDRLLAKGELDEGEEMYLDALSDLVGAYEDDHHPIAPASDADLLRHLMADSISTFCVLFRHALILHGHEGKMKKRDVIEQARVERGVGLRALDEDGGLERVAGFDGSGRGGRCGWG